jgi:hypothetical protein
VHPRPLLIITTIPNTMRRGHTCCSSRDCAARINLADSAALSEESDRVGTTSVWPLIARLTLCRTLSNKISINAQRSIDRCAPCVIMNTSAFSLPKPPPPRISAADGSAPTGPVPDVLRVTVLLGALYADFSFDRRC